jgi:phosphatidylserine/phosphatidylglycerophosphate/cardiolipin synthase-like enzyme
MDIATGYFEIGALLALDGEWQKVDQIRVLMGDEVSLRTKRAFVEGLDRATARLDESIEAEKERNDFLAGVPAIVEAIRDGRIGCRVYRREKFHAKTYITHARQEVLGSFALVGSSNLTYPGISENVELNVQITGRQVAALQEWYEAHWSDAEDVTPEILRTIERHIREYSPFEVYARALQEFFRSNELTADEWEETRSRGGPSPSSTPAPSGPTVKGGRATPTIGRAPRRSWISTVTAGTTSSSSHRARRVCVSSPAPAASWRRPEAAATLGPPCRLSISKAMVSWISSRGAS